MGLQERRKIKELQESILPSRSKEIEEICGRAIPYEVDWDSLADNMEGLNFLDNLSCHRVNMALRMVCTDDLSRDAVANGLRLIKLKNVADRNSMKMTFENGVLEMHCAYALRTDGLHDEGAIKNLLLRKL
jgi:hypothetical protein